jgi:hypothetical protein
MSNACCQWGRIRDRIVIVEFVRLIECYLLLDFKRTLVSVYSCENGTVVTF